MSEQKQDGGPAFPGAWHPEMGWSPTQIPSGMSLRDWFAGQALAGIAANPEGITVDGETKRDPSAYALVAYLLADAMLAEREKRGVS